MNTNQLKIFATKAREILRHGVLNKLHWLGFDDDGRSVDKERPRVYEGGTAWRGVVYPESFGRQWLALASHIQRHGLREVVEEGAYTWFNRLMAIRILAKNNLCEPILAYSETGLPMLVEDAHVGRIPEMSAQRRAQLEELISGNSKPEAQFALLITEWCRQNPIINECFGSIDDYVELLLPLDITAPSGFINLLNTTVNLTEDDYRSSELIGWLYQFYISDRKDEVFAKKGKVEADEIPAATQIFTPNWIVKYMLQNSVLPQLGITEGEYLVHNDDAPVVDRFTSSQLESFKIADLACGSGHILVEAFDMLYNLYTEEGYMPDEAIGYIFRNNLLGIDIDLRAQQLAKFALMLKAAQRDESLALEPIVPQVLTIPEFVDFLSTSKYREENGSLYRQLFHDFFRDSVSHDVAREIEGTFDLLKDARSLGSIMKFDISASARRALVETVKYWSAKETVERPEFVNDFLPAAKLILALTDKYDAIVMNPPYMGGGKMDNVLSKYVKDNYPDSKADLMTVFMEVARNLTVNRGYWSMINLPSWMFLDSFYSLRNNLVYSQQIIGLNQNGRGVFGSDFGSVTFVIQNTTPYKKGIYRRLFKKHVEVRANTVIEGLYKNQNFAKYVVSQDKFIKIPGLRITAYWATDRMLEAFETGANLGTAGTTRKGMYTGLNEKYVRLWFEVLKTDLALRLSVEESKISPRKWYPYANGGIFRKWYGNYWDVVFWQYYGKRLRTERNQDGKIRAGCFNLQYIFTKGVVWNSIGSGTNSMRIMCDGTLFSSASNGWFGENPKLVLALLNSKVAEGFLNIINPTINANPGDLALIPLLGESGNVERITNECIEISISDWDAHETSWDFKTNELVALGQEGLGCIKATINDEIASQYFNLEILMTEYKTKWENLFYKLHSNEEELNRQFIEIYGLQDELTPDVPLNEVTILQQGEIRITDQYRLTTEDDKYIVDEKGRYLTVSGEPYLDWQDDVIIKQLISYIVGCWMGRYRLDRPGLNIAHPDATEEELEPYVYGPDAEEFEIDDDAIIPVLPKGSPFADNLTSRIEDFVRIVWGEEAMADNLNFMEQCLGKSVDDYVNKDFWKDHKKMYQNRPIYWLFSSKKGAFKCLVYAHRMTKHTVSVIRSKYLLRYINWMEEKVTAMSARADRLSTREQKDLEKTYAAITECHEYHNRLQQVAERAIEFDLDDGILHNHALFGDILVKLK